MENLHIHIQRTDTIHIVENIASLFESFLRFSGVKLVYLGYNKHRV